MFDSAVANPSFSIKAAARGLNLSVGRTNSLVATLTDLGVLQPLGTTTYNRRFDAPRVLDVLLDRGWSRKLRHLVLSQLI